MPSQKDQEIDGDPKAALVLHWKSMQRQLLVRRMLKSVSTLGADTYYVSRPYLSRLGAWASEQSAELKSRATLVARVAKLVKRYPTDPPRPPHWHGFRLRPLAVEFWLGHEHRLHDRFHWSRPTIDAADWSRARLSP